MNRIEVIIAGVGGQGSILAGTILGSAAVTYDHKYAVQTQSYSSELRGGAAVTWVVISDEPIEHPRVEKPEILVAQDEGAIDRYLKFLRPGGILIIDSDVVHKALEGDFRLLKVPATSLARDELKTAVVSNIIILGALIGAREIVSRKAVEEAIVSTVPPRAKEVNQKAFELGLAIGSQS